MAEVTDYTALLMGQHIVGPRVSGTPAFYTFSFPTTIAPYNSEGTQSLDYSTFRAFTEAEKTVARAAIAQWAAASGLVIFEVSRTPGDMQFLHIGLQGSLSGLASSPAGAGPRLNDPSLLISPDALASDVWIAPNAAVNLEILLHEIGHALGFKHSFQAFGAPYDKTLAASLDNQSHTVMSYTRGPGPTVVLGEIDTAAIQYLYGPNSADGTQVQSWNWDAALEILTQTGFDTKADVIVGVAAADRINAGAGDDIVAARAGNDIVFGGVGNDRLYGGDGADILAGDGGDDYLDGGNGLDVASYETASSAVTVSLAQGGVHITSAAGSDTFVSIEGLRGSAFNDALTGDDAVNTLEGGLGDDQLIGGGGDDLLLGGGGNDTIDGGGGNDVARYSARKMHYAIVQNSDGSTTVSDLRSGAPDGIDRLVGVETIAFAADPTAGEVATQISAILRQSATAAAVAPLAESLLARWSAETLSAQQVTAEIVKAADASTSVATLAYQFFTGKIPSAGGIDFLVSPTGPNANNLNSAYYQTFNLENRYINFAMNLGKVGEGNAKFAAEYGSLSLFEATKKAYAAVFGAVPTDAKVSALLSGGRDAYFASYGQDGLNGIGTKAAMVGWLLAEAEKADLGVMARANAAWLTDLADGAAPYAVDILNPSNGYWKAEFVFGGG